MRYLAQLLLLPPSTPTNALEFLNHVHGHVPACSSNITTLCPSLYSGADTCWNVSWPKSCFCQNLLQIPCHSICTLSEQPAMYLHWINVAWGALTNTTLGSHSVNVFL